MYLDTYSACAVIDYLSKDLNRYFAKFSIKQTAIILYDRSHFFVFF